MNINDMIPWERRQILEWIRLCRSIGPIKKPAPFRVLIDDVVHMSCACGKTVKVAEMPRRNSGVVTYVDNLCPGCTSHGKGLATVICAKCRQVAMRMGPFRDKYGFKVAAGDVLHIDGCKLCTPGVEKSDIIEMLIFHRERGIRG